jgi:ABC-type nitrate/sulfonate/bicarbonate transport system ATPase subunit
MVNYLAQSDSMIVHACGVDYEGKGILFVGESGAGKSTLTKIWNQEPGVEILSDDRIIVRKKMINTGCMGRHGMVMPNSHRLPNWSSKKYSLSDTVKRIQSKRWVEPCRCCNS